MKIKNEKILIISIILFVAITFSLIHPIIFGYGVEFLDEPNPIQEIKNGTAKTIDMHIRSYSQEKVLVDFNVKFENKESKNYLKLNVEDIHYSAPLSYFHTPKTPVRIEAINYDENEKTHMIIFDLYVNGKVLDTKILEIKIKK